MVEIIQIKNTFYFSFNVTKKVFMLNLELKPNEFYLAILEKVKDMTKHVLFNFFGVIL